MTEGRGGRGEGNMANALRTRRRRAPEVPSAQRPLTSRAGRRNRKKTGKRSNPDYMLASAFVHREVYERVRQALLSGEVKREVLLELAERGVLHQRGKPLYSDLVELLLREWLERVGWELEEGA
jgi:hypothetical protein